MELYLLHEYYNEEHLEAVKAEMAKLGAPVIRAIYDDCNDIYIALEGSHRIRAAKALGLTPIIDEVDYNDVCDLSVKDPALNLDLDNDWTVEELVNDSIREAVIIEF